MVRMTRKSKGRQKIEMVKMTKESNLQVTFSKRRAGLFKKASELSTLCGVEIAIIVFSPGKKVFSFGHPNVPTIIDRFLTGHQAQAMHPATLQLIEARNNFNLREHNKELTQILDELEIEKKRSVELNQMKEARESLYWWEKPLEDQTPDQLVALKGSLEKLRVKVAKQAEKIVFESSAPHQFFTIDASSNDRDHANATATATATGFTSNTLPRDDFDGGCKTNDVAHHFF